MGSEGGRDARYRSGEHVPPVAMDTERLIALHRDEAAAAARSAAAMEALLQEVRGLRTDINAQGSQLNEQKLEMVRAAGESSRRHEAHGAALNDHSRQLNDIWKRFDEKRSVWAGVLPAVIGSVVSGLICSAVTGAIVYVVTHGAHP